MNWKIIQTEPTVKEGDKKMDKNIYFPDWLTANIMIRSFLKQFGVYAWNYEDEPTRLNVTFLPPGIFYTVPEEDRELFVRIYNIFSNWVQSKTNFKSAIEKYVYSPMVEDVKKRIEHTIQSIMYNYEKKSGIEMKIYLAACFGIEPAFILPKELLEELNRAAGSIQREVK